MKSKYVFTVTAGRSGQVSLSEIINKYSINCHAEVEHPEIQTFFKGRLGKYEHNFRRRFIETNELLGRGKVLTSFVDNDINYIASIAKKKETIFNALLKGNSKIYFDVGKHFARGLHLGFDQVLESYSVVLLVRDPMENILSFIRRDKDFYRDNNHPSDLMNQYVFIKDKYTPVELYAWMWVEIYLRFLSMVKSDKINSYYVLHTQDLNKKEKIMDLFEVLGLKGNFTDFKAIKMNTSNSRGASLSTNERDQFLSFISDLPVKILNKIPILKKYAQ
jgi:hypothetical protein